MSRLTFFPSTDAALLAWSLNFSTLITAAPTSYGLTSTLATAYGTLHTNFGTALAACEPSIRTKSAVATKNTARTALKNDARLLANLVNGTATVTNAQKIALGIPPRSLPSPIPAPSTSPVIAIVSATGRTVKIGLKATDRAKRGKPAGVRGASIFSYVGATPPADAAAWHFEGSTTKTVVEILFADTVASGATVWFTAFWFNNRSQSGPGATAISTALPGGTAMPMAA